MNNPPLPMNVEQLIGRMVRPADFRRIVLAYFVIDVVMNSQRERCFRTFHCATAQWKDGIDYIKIENGGGDAMDILLDAEHYLVKGFGHESDISPYIFDEQETGRPVTTGEFFDGAPHNLLDALDDPAISKKETTFCLWAKCSDATWSKGRYHLPANCYDGFTLVVEEIIPLEAEFFAVFCAYHGFGNERDKSGAARLRQALHRIIAEQRLDDQTMLAINPEADISMARQEILGGMASFFIR